MPPNRAAELLNVVTRAPPAARSSGRQVARQREVAQVITAELQLEAVGGGLALGRLHDARVVDQEVDRPPLGVEFLAERFDAGQRGQVERFDGQLRVGHRRADLLDRRFALGAVADRHDDVGARSGQAGSDAETEAGVGAGDDGQLSGLIGDRCTVSAHGPWISPLRRVDNRTITNHRSDNKSPSV